MNLPQIGISGPATVANVSPRSGLPQPGGQTILDQCQLATGDGSENAVVQVPLHLLQTLMAKAAQTETAHPAGPPVVPSEQPSIPLNELAEVVKKEMGEDSFGLGGQLLSDLKAQEQTHFTPGQIADACKKVTTFEDPWKGRQPDLLEGMQWEAESLDIALSRYL